MARSFYTFVPYICHLSDSSKAKKHAMPRIKATIDYDGTHYQGWQRQAHTEKTVQSVLESALTVLCRETISVIGCGRTDSGVHARGYVLHFDGQPTDLEQLVYKANKILPEDISVLAMEEVSGDFHARYGARQRSYAYSLHVGKQVFERGYSFRYPYKTGDVDLGRLNEAAALLVGERDFTCFCKTGSDQTHNLCHVYRAGWVEHSDGRYRFEIQANRYLRGMIRLIVGMCLNVSRGRVSLDEVEQALLHAHRLELDWSVPALGLCLYDIIYD